MASEEPYVYATRIVRVFPDDAGSVIWFSEPIPYYETCLSEGLVSRLIAWEASYYAGLTENYEWRSPAHLHQFRVEGLELAHEVAREIGPEFEVGYRSYGNVKALLQSVEEAVNPSARDAFASRAELAVKDWTANRARLAKIADSLDRRRRP
ncbi:hypothetical protein [Agreia sp.]|uniref:hypothetical protein n=1 Tax=Agreia sp. TaxID=1872416 RepID=UPI0035BBA45D